MRIDIENIVEDMLKLPLATRAYLAEMLLQSLDYEEDFSISEEWMNEIHRRCHEINEEQIQLVNAEDALAQLQKKYS
ncbi:MAG: addiction module protein [Candidatus Competibacteraceae bacterium]|nr:addiction module protein [Candidatus Competibacteraceae bacterium]